MPSHVIVGSYDGIQELTRTLVVEEECILIKNMQDTERRIMERYKVTVCRFGHVMVEAESEEAARKHADELMPEQICWKEKSGQTSPFIVVYAEPDGETPSNM